MPNSTVKTGVLAALIVATGITAVELTRSSAQADALSSPAGSVGYAAQRIDGAFAAVADAMPFTTPVTVPLAAKGDLPIPPACLDLAVSDQAECMDIAYEVESLPSVVVETRFGTTSTLLRLDAMTVAGVEGETGTP